MCSHRTCRDRFSAKIRFFYVSTARDPAVFTSDSHRQTAPRYSRFIAPFFVEATSTHYPITCESFVAVGAIQCVLVIRESFRGEYGSRVFHSSPYRLLWYILSLISCLLYNNENALYSVLSNDFSSRLYCRSAKSWTGQGQAEALSAFDWLRSRFGLSASSRTLQFLAERP